MALLVGVKPISPQYQWRDIRATFSPFRLYSTAKIPSEGVLCLAAKVSQKIDKSLIKGLCEFFPPV